MNNFYKNKHLTIKTNRNKKWGSMGRIGRLFIIGLFQNVFGHFQGNQPNFLLLIRPTYQNQKTNQNRLHLQMIPLHRCRLLHF